MLLYLKCLFEIKQLIKIFINESISSATLMENNETFRWSHRLRRSGMLLQSHMPQQPAVRLSAQTNRYIATETAARHYRFLFRENEVPNRRGQSAELRSSGDFQREVSSSSIVARFSPLVLATNVVVMILVVSALNR